MNGWAARTWRNWLGRWRRTRARGASTDGETYKAFLSYSHAVDGKLAPALQRALQDLGRPWYRVRALRVFRDKTSLSATPTLWPSIERALAASEFLILLASPEAARSEWIAREVEYWRAHKPPHKLLVALTGGELHWDDETGDFAWERTSALPPFLSGAFVEEPLYVDLRWARRAEQLSHRHPEFRDAVAGLAAPLQGCRKEDIFSEDIRQHRRTLRLVRGAVVVLATLAALATLFAVVAQDRGNQARLERDRAEGQSQLATSRYLAAQGTIRFDSDPQLSLLLSLAAFRTRDTADSRNALLRQATDRHGLRGIINCENDLANAVALSPDGRVIACAGVANVGFWNARTYVKQGETEFRPTSSLAYNRDGTYLAMGSVSLTVRNLRTSNELSLGGLGTSTEAVAFDPSDGNILAAGREDGSVRIWNVPTRTHTTLPGHRGKVTGVAFTADGRTLAASGEDGEILVWGSNAGGTRGWRRMPGWTLAGGSGSLNSVAFSPDGRTLGAASDRGTVLLWNARTGRRRGTLSGHSAPVNSVAFSPAGRILASGSVDGTVMLWNRSTGTRATLTGHTNSVSNVAFSADGKVLASAGTDNRVFLWDAEPTPFILRGHTVHARSVAFSPTDRLLASGDDDGAVVLWDSRTGRRRATLEGHGEPVEALAFSRNGRLLASAGGKGGEFARDLPDCPSVDAGHRPMQQLIAGGRRDPPAAGRGTPNSIILWNPRIGRRVATLVGHRDSVKDVAFSPDGGRIASASSDDTVILWDTQTGRRVARLTGHSGTVGAVAFSPDGSRLASGGNDGKAIVWDARTRRSLMTLRHERGVDGVAFGPTGRTLATASSDGVVLWNLRRPRNRIASLCTGLALDVAFSPDGKTLASAGADGTVGIWDPRSGSRLLGLTDHYRGQIDAVAFSADGHTVASIGSDTQVILRNVDRTNLSQRLCHMAGRDLTPEEHRLFVPRLKQRRLCPRS